MRMFSIAQVSRLCRCVQHEEGLQRFTGLSEGNGGEVFRQRESSTRVSVERLKIGRGRGGGNPLLLDTSPFRKILEFKQTS